MILIRVFLFVFLVVPAWAQEKGWEKEWNRIIAAGKKEGKVVVYGPPDAAARRQIPARFKARYGIPVEYISGRRGLIARIRMERRAGHLSLDVYLGGFGTAATVLYPEKMIDPMKPVLILPEVIDPSKWKKGKPWFMDPGEKYILRLLNNVGGMIYINTQHVKREELKLTKDLLNPKWRGKISTLDPTNPGAGRSQAAKFYLQFGEEFVKKLYIDQKPVISRNERQLVDWLARGTYPISIAAPTDGVERVQKQGFPVTAHALADTSGYVSMGNGALALMNKAPHPNAAIVFVNWMASKEGLETYSKAHYAATTRNDIDESFLPAGRVPRAGVKYFDTNEWGYATGIKDQVKRRLRELLRSR